MDNVCFNCFLPSFLLSLHISLILSLCFSHLSSVQTAPVFIFRFSWKPLIFLYLFISGIRSVMSSCEVPQYHFSFHWSMYWSFSELILQPFRHFTYVAAHSPTLHRFTYVTAHSPTLPLLCLRHSSFYSSSVASPTSYALHLRHLASRPCPYDDV